MCLIVYHVLNCFLKIIQKTAMFFMVTTILFTVCFTFVFAIFVGISFGNNYSLSTSTNPGNKTFPRNISYRSDKDFFGLFRKLLYQLLPTFDQKKTTVKTENGSKEEISTMSDKQIITERRTWFSIISDTTSAIENTNTIKKSNIVTTSPRTVTYQFTFETETILVNYRHPTEAQKEKSYGLIPAKYLQQGLQIERIQDFTAKLDAHDYESWPGNNDNLKNIQGYPKEDITFRATEKNQFGIVNNSTVPGRIQNYDENYFRVKNINDNTHQIEDVAVHENKQYGKVENYTVSPVLAHRPLTENDFFVKNYNKYNEIEEPARTIEDEELENDMEFEKMEFKNNYYDYNDFEDLRTPNDGTIIKLISKNYGLGEESYSNSKDILNIEQLLATNKKLVEDLQENKRSKINKESSNARKAIFIPRKAHRKTQSKISNKKHNLIKKPTS